MKNNKVVLVIRILAGAMLIFSGLNKIFHWVTPEMEGDSVTAMMGFMAISYLMPMVAIVEVIAGITFISNKFATLGALILAPISVNIIAFHLAYDPVTIGGAVLVFAANVLVLLANKEKLIRTLEI